MKNRRSNGKKRLQYRGVCDPRSNQMRDELLPTVPVDGVREIGAASAAKLAKIGLRRPPSRRSRPDNARALVTVTGGRTVYELRGSPVCRWS